MNYTLEWFTQEEQTGIFQTPQMLEIRKKHMRDDETIADTIKSLISSNITIERLINSFKMFEKTSYDSSTRTYIESCVLNHFDTSDFKKLYEQISACGWNSVYYKLLSIYPELRADKSLLHQLLHLKGRKEDIRRAIILIQNDRQIIANIIQNHTLPSQTFISTEDSLITYQHMEPLQLLMDHIGVKSYCCRQNINLDNIQQRFPWARLSECLVQYWLECDMTQSAILIIISQELNKLKDNNKSITQKDNSYLNNCILM